MYIQADPFGFRDMGFQGASFFSAPNPKPGAVFTYFIKDEIKSLKEQRRDEEKEKQKKGEDIKYPAFQTLRTEQEEPSAYLLFTITDERGNIIKKIKTEPVQGVNRISWDFRYSPFTVVSLEPFDYSVPWNDPDRGYMVVPGTYDVSLSKYVDGKFTELVPPQKFVCKPLNTNTLSAEDQSSLDQFNKKVASLTRAISGADTYRQSLADKIVYLEKSVIDGANVPDSVYNSVLSVKQQLDAFNRSLNGDPLIARYEGGSPTSVKARVDLVTGALWTTTAAPTTTFRQSYDAAADKFGELLDRLKMIDNNVRTLELKLEKFGAPATPGRFPEWKKE